jgi:photosystem II stability/assembly factor-like uncharacterized protein
MPAPLSLALIWSMLSSGTTASLRGVAAVDDRVVWASGSGGTWLRTTNGGTTWTAAQIPSAGKLDFRDVQAVDANTAYLLASGPGDQSRIYKTVDAGKNWTLQFTNPDTSGFLDAFAFWDPRHALTLGDPVEGRFGLFSTNDGVHWERQLGPIALPQEGAFAASGTCLITTGKHDAWFGTSAARVFHSNDDGKTWMAVQTTIRHETSGSGIFSLAFADTRHGIVVGGDYMHPELREHNIALTSDGGRTWIEPSRNPPTGYRSAVTYVPVKKAWIAVGTSGSDISYDNGATWEPLGREAFNAVSFARSGKGWAVGPNGAVAVLPISTPVAQAGKRVVP